MHSPTPPLFPWQRLAPVALLLPLLTLLWTAPADARRERLALDHHAVELPGAPATLLTHDLDGDGRRDLVVLVVYTYWDQIGIEEEVHMDAVDGLVEMLTIVPTLQDRRELHVFLARDDGDFEAAGNPLEVGPEILTLARLGAPAPHPGAVVALTDDGLSRLVLDTTGPRFEPWLDEPPILAGTGTFLGDLDLVHDLDGDGWDDLLLPTASGTAVILGSADGPRRAGAPLALPFDAFDKGSTRVRYVPLPEVRDVDGDGGVDLLLAHPEEFWSRLQVLPSEGGARFGSPLAPRGLGEDPDDPETSEDTGDGGDRAVEVEVTITNDEEPAEPTVETDASEDTNEDDPLEGSVVYFGDLDGDGRAEWVTHRELLTEDAGTRQEIAEAKRPPGKLRFYRSRSDLAPEAEPFHQLDVIGYGFDSDHDDDGFELPGGFQDLDGDGRLDYVAITLDFSVAQVMRAAVTHRFTLGLDFHLWCQGDDGAYSKVPGLDLSGKFRLDLDDLKIRQLSQFAGDFDGDGRADFVQLGRGKRVTIHRGQDHCRYAANPDLVIDLEEAPKDLALVQVRDVDGDELSDLVIIQPQRVDEAGVTPPVRLDLYLSGATR